MRRKAHRETTLEYDNVILGSSVEAMVAAYVHQLPIFGNRGQAPIPFYYLPVELDLSPILVDNQKNVYTNLSFTKEFFGMQKVELWNIMMHRLSIMGLAPMYGDYIINYFTDLDEIVKLKDSNSFTLSVKDKIVNVKAKNVIIFDYPSFHNGHSMYMVNDYMKLRNTKNLKADIITEVTPIPRFMDTACYQTIVYKEGKSTHCCVKSLFSEGNLDEWTCSATAMRLKSETTFYWNVDKKIKVEILNREVSPVLKPLYTDLEEIMTLNVVEQELL